MDSNNTCPAFRDILTESQYNIIFDWNGSCAIIRGKAGNRWSNMIQCCCICRGKHSPHIIITLCKQSKCGGSRFAHDLRIAVMIEIEVHIKHTGSLWQHIPQVCLLNITVIRRKRPFRCIKVIAGNRIVPGVQQRFAGVGNAVKINLA